MNQKKAIFILGVAFITGTILTISINMIEKPAPIIEFDGPM